MASGIGNSIDHAVELLNSVNPSNSKKIRLRENHSIVVDEDKKAGEDGIPLEEFWETEHPWATGTHYDFIKQAQMTKEIREYDSVIAFHDSDLFNHPTVHAEMYPPVAALGLQILALRLVNGLNDHLPITSEIHTHNHEVAAKAVKVAAAGLNKYPEHKRKFLAEVRRLKKSQHHHHHNTLPNDYLTRAPSSRSDSRGVPLVRLGSTQSVNSDSVDFDCTSRFNVQVNGEQPPEIDENTVLDEDSESSEDDDGMEEYKLTGKKEWKIYRGAGKTKRISLPILADKVVAVGAMQTLDKNSWGNKKDAAATLFSSVKKFHDKAKPPPEPLPIPTKEEELWNGHAIEVQMINELAMLNYLVGTEEGINKEQEKKKRRTRTTISTSTLLLKTISRLRCPQSPSSLI